MDRSYSTGIGLALIGHVLLFGALSLTLFKPKPLPKLEVTPVEVSLVDEVALQSSAPDLTPAPAPAPADSAPEPAPEPAFEPDISPTPPEPVIVPEPRPTPPKPVAKPVPLPKPVAKPQPPKPVTLPKPTPPKPVTAKPAAKPVAKPSTKPATTPPATKPRKPGISLDSSIIGNAKSESGRSATQTPATNGGMRAQKTVAQWEASFIQSVLRKIQPFWKAPTGADAELLKTNLLIRLNRDGSVASVSVASQTGVTDSNQNLKALHAERAIKAVQRAGRFDGLPDELYDIWQTLGPITFDKKL